MTNGLASVLFMIHLPIFYSVYGMVSVNRKLIAC